MRKCGSIKQLYRITFQPSGINGMVPPGISVLDAARELGESIDSICNGRTHCLKCKIKVIDNDLRENNDCCISPVTQTERQCLSSEELAAGIRLACQSEITGDISIFIPNESRISAQIIRKKIKKLTIEPKPAVKKYFIDLAQIPAANDNTSCAEQLLTYLRSSHKLDDLSFDISVLRDLYSIIKNGEGKITISVWQNKKIIAVETGLCKQQYGVAFDIGSTTVAGYLCDLITGDVCATTSRMNPQIAWGDDVMSRITHLQAVPQDLKKLNGVIISCIQEILRELCAEVNIDESAILDMLVVGNTCMHHIFLNIPPTTLGRAPFLPIVRNGQDVKARDLGLRIAAGAYVHMLPLKAGFIGSDIISGVMVTQPYKNREYELLIDIGTNGEMVFGNNTHMLSTSCATGPAFEGGQIKFGMRAAAGAIDKVIIDKITSEVQYHVLEGNKIQNTQTPPRPVGICGSGIIDAVAQLYLAGIIDETGRFVENKHCTRLIPHEKPTEFVIAWSNETSIDENISITQEDIRAVQLAKAAMYAGEKILMSRLGVEKPDRIKLAGAFGSYIDKNSAAAIGLFPDCVLERIHPIGNAAGEGACLALLNMDIRNEVEAVAGRIEHVELTLQEDFQDTFIEAMWFPHQK